MEGILLQRTLTSAVHGKYEDEYVPAEILYVTQEANGCALWHERTGLRRVIAWGHRNDVISYAAIITRSEARRYADEATLNYNVPSLSELAEKGDIAEAKR